MMMNDDNHEDRQSPLARTRPSEAHISEHRAVCFWPWGGEVELEELEELEVEEVEQVEMEVKAEVKVKVKVMVMVEMEMEMDGGERFRWK